MLKEGPGEGRGGGKGWKLPSLLPSMSYTFNIYSFIIIILFLQNYKKSLSYVSFSIKQILQVKSEFSGYQKNAIYSKMAQFPHMFIINDDKPIYYIFNIQFLFMREFGGFFENNQNLKFSSSEMS